MSQSQCFTSCNWRTEGQTRIHSAIMTIPGFSNVLEGKRKQIIIQEIEDGVSKVRIHLKIQLVGHCNDLAEIYYRTMTPLFMKAILTISLQRFEERTIVMTEHQNIQANKWQYLSTIYKNNIVSDVMKYLLGDGSLRLKFQFLVTKINPMDSALSPVPRLSTDFERLLDCGLFSDVVIVSNDEVLYKAHKAVLSGRSPVMRAALEHDLEEKRTSTIHSPLESAVLDQVLTFIYTDQAPKIREMGEKLLAAADYYQLDRLKCLCEQAMYEQLTIENCIDTLRLADRHSASLLKSSTLQYIKDGRAKDVTDTESWAKLDRIDVIKTIYQFIVTEEEVLDLL